MPPRMPAFSYGTGRIIVVIYITVTCMYETEYQKTLLASTHRSCTGAVWHSAPFRLKYVTLNVSWAKAANFEHLCTVELEKHAKDTNWVALWGSQVLAQCPALGKECIPQHSKVGW